MQHTLMAGQQVPTPTLPQKCPTIHPQIPPPQINTAGIPVYHFDALAIQALLPQATATTLRNTQGGSHEIKEDGVSTYFKL